MVDTLHISVVCQTGPRQCLHAEFTLPPGATLAQAVARFAQHSPQALDAYLEAGRVGVWGRRAQPGQTLRDNDRVELYRPLQVDPKLARRERFKKQGAGSVAGRFAKLRPNAKPGY